VHLDERHMYIVRLQGVHQSAGLAGRHDAVTHAVEDSHRALHRQAARATAQQHQVLAALLEERQWQGLWCHLSVLVPHDFAPSQGELHPTFTDLGSGDVQDRIDEVDMEKYPPK